MRTSFALAHLLALALVSGGCSKLLGISDPGSGDDGGVPPGDTGIDGPPPCIAPPAYGAVATYELTGTPGLMAVGDLDSDGKPDVAIALTSKVLILHGDGTGKLGRPQDVDTAAEGVVIDNFELVDNARDLVLWNASGSILVERRQDTAVGSEGQFLPAQPLPVPAGFATVSQVKKGYFDGNLVPDVMVRDAREIRSYTANNPGGFSLGKVIGAAGDQLVQVESLDPKDREAVVLVGADGAVKIVTQTAGNFDAPRQVATGAAGTAVALGQLDGDSKRDLIVATPSGGVVYTQTSTGGAPAFTKRSDTIPGVTGSVLQVADVDGNGRDDLLVAGGIIQQCEPGTFSSLVPIPTAASTVVADLDNNNKPDLLRIAGTVLEVRVQ